MFVCKAHDIYKTKKPQAPNYPVDILASLVYRKYIYDRHFTANRLTQSESKLLL